MRSQVSIDNFIRLFIFLLIVVIGILVVGATSGIIKFVKSPYSKNLIQNTQDIKSP